MSAQLQYALAIVIVACAVLLAVRAAVNLVRGKKSALNACQSCALRESCTRAQSGAIKKCDEKVAQSRK